MKRVKSLFSQNCKPLRLTPLRNIDKTNYYSWQKSFRKISPEKPLLLDVLWAAKSFEDVFMRTLEGFEDKSQSARF